MNVFKFLIASINNSKISYEDCFLLEINGSKELKNHIKTIFTEYDSKYYEDFYNRFDKVQASKWMAKKMITSNIEIYLKRKRKLISLT